MIAQVVQVLLAFGANLGDRGATIRAAQAELAAAAGLKNFEASPLRETIAMTEAGPDPDAPRYVNGVARADTALSPHELLDLLQETEARFGRVRETRWGDRTLDIDIILYGGRVVKDERLTVPHPRAFERDFVLAPWLDLDPNAVLMGHGRVTDLLARAGDTTWPLDESVGDEPAVGESVGDEPAVGEPAVGEAAIDESGSHAEA